MNNILSSMRAFGQMVWVILSLAICLGVVSCSTTEKLPEDELLYTGIDKVIYTDVPGTTENKTDSATTEEAITLPPISKAEKKKMKALRDRLKEEINTTQKEVESVLDFAPNNALFGSSYARFPIPIGLWSYNKFVDSKTKFGKWMHRTFSSDPLFISSASPETRVQVATNTLHNYGHFQGEVNYEIVPQSHPKKAKLKYTIAMGPVWRLDSVEYRGFSPRMDSLLRQNITATFLKRNDAFSVINLANEQSRIEQLFKENGYYYYSADMTTYSADTLQHKGRVQLRVQPDELRP